MQEREKQGKRGRGENDFFGFFFFNRELGKPFCFPLSSPFPGQTALYFSCTLSYRNSMISHKRAMVSRRAKVTWSNQPKNSWKVTGTHTWMLRTTLVALIGLEHIRFMKMSGLLSSTVWCKTCSFSYQFASLLKTSQFCQQFLFYLLNF